MSGIKQDGDRIGYGNVPAVLGSSDAGLDISEVPEPPPGLSETLQQDWVGAWTSPIARVIDPVSDLPAMRRLFELRALAEVYARSGNADPKLANVRIRLNSEIRMQENALGLSPRARLALGLALLAGQKQSAGLDGFLDDSGYDDED
ncbi:hypothetical protein [Nonomuraea sp. SYSU D8015]|uniref:hypothetical protein n=1 Tax=Nonomuraea sp. SYSU D8015 TaxID=2593644 RepID=UPI00166149BE|nr:hypothetical protein [Nonomuraea sp. SYSU D8015]